MFCNDSFVFALLVAQVCVTERVAVRSEETGTDSQHPRENQLHVQNMCAKLSNL